MSRAPATNGLVSRDYLEFPDGLPPDISNLAFQVTRNEDSRFEQAVALQQWFREDGGFKYDIRADEGNGTDDLLRFLSSDPGGRVGYCEQFASAMAVMARTLGIPSRVAVGFYKPDPGRVRHLRVQRLRPARLARAVLPRVGLGEVRAHPQRPRHERPVLHPRADPGRAEPERSVPPPRQRASRARRPATPRRPARRPRTRRRAPTTTRRSRGCRCWAAAPGRCSSAGLLLTPRLVRTRRRQRRLAGQPEVAWAELRDTAVDLGVPWPPDRSPRETRDHLAGYLGHPVSDRTPERPGRGAGVAPAASDALDRLVHDLEVSRYARTRDAGPDPARVADLETVLASLAGGAPRRDRRRAPVVAAVGAAP